VAGQPQQPIHPHAVNAALFAALFAVILAFAANRCHIRRTRCDEWDTALRDIKILLDRGILAQEEGGGRSTSYRLADPGFSPAQQVQHYGL